MIVQNLLDHPPVQCTLTDPSARFWLRDLLISAAERDPVDTIADLDAARSLVVSYLDALTYPGGLLLAQEMPEGR